MQMWKQWMAGFIAAGTVLTGCNSSQSVTVDATVDLPAETKYIALTFDDGPRAGTTERLLNGLRERGASATFFLVGEQAAAFPDLVTRMKAEGHQIGNHTWSHARLEGMEAEAMKDEIANMDNLLNALVGEGSYWLRPPYGQLTPGTEKLVKVPMVKWSVDPRDWESRNKEKIVEAVLEKAKPNSIVLLHDIYDSSVDAALEIVDRLQEQGYWFVTVEELLRLNGIVPQSGMLYRSGNG